MDYNTEKGNSLQNTMTETAAILEDSSAKTSISSYTDFRKSTQYMLPLEKGGDVNGYDVFPSFKIEDGKIASGFESLADWLSNHKQVILDGDPGVCWNDFTKRLAQVLKNKNVQVELINIETALKPEEQVNGMISPYLGGDDPIFGKVFEGSLVDFFDKEKLDAIQPAQEGLTILYGTGAALVNWGSPVVFLEVPKNEVQYRSRAGVVRNIGELKPASPKQQYKRFYFVDWVIMNKHKKEWLPKVSVVVDEQRGADITWILGEDLRNALKVASENVFRARPWFEAGAWGGDWIKDHIQGVTPDVPNYAWSFELITPENGIVFESDKKLLEVSFANLMHYDNKAILGKAAERFKDEFPIRFDFLDTYSGGNLSVQCHPTNEYIKENFGENFTQDETYYILDAEPDAKVYLGFQENIDKENFKTVLEKSAAEKQPIEVEDFVQVFSAKKHDLFLIPNGTVHCSGIDNMVLEISSTPYIYTFKMYDWVRLDLDGNPRPLNIDRAFENLNFDLKGDKVTEELISKQTIMEAGADWQLINLSTHPEHFYAVHRFEFETEVHAKTEGQCHILSLVEGSSIIVKTGDVEQQVSYAETFVIPAAAKAYTLINKGQSKAKVVKAFVKDESC
ncbi:class I mannose-6-phosphate isomerase [Rufibacter roseus]|uniref:Class I mannose-6-phosphate isomerase n=1 Tax=Rufibacter roseus TaxID=1567108 RepID=A0ABW2DGY6_9BACT|nr:class I mannose-6-phosphate isomerase [Rufibacter roseus]